jgi:hypothetical protein
VIGLLLVTLLLLLAILLSGMEALAAIPLLLVPLSAILRARWVGLVGLLAFCAVGLGSLKGAELTDLPRFGALTASLVIPCVILMELLLSDRTVPAEKVSLWPIAVISGLLLLLMTALALLLRLRMIGVYLGSDPTLQVFVLMSLSILISGPILLTTGLKGPPTDKKGSQTVLNGQRTNKNE